MFKKLIRWLSDNYKQDRHGNYHKHGCILYNEKFTVIKNSGGSKIWGNIKYCPCCGAELKG